MIKIGGWQLETVHGGNFSIDGGAAFGVVPKTVWQKYIPADQNNLVRFACHCLLAQNGDKKVLIDTGYGGKHPLIDRNAYQMDSGNPILESLARKGIVSEQIDLVLFTHLHFDHAGGATVFDKNRRLIPAFPNAVYMAGNWEWEDAVSCRPELAAAYPQNNIRPLLENGHVRKICDGEVILSGLTAVRTGGHTRGHFAFVFEEEQHAQGAVFIGDLCPTSLHLRLLWNMSYDTFLLVTRQKKRDWLNRIAEKHWWLFFPHDPRMTVCKIKKSSSENFTVIPSVNTGTLRNQN
jgi:glyoxylase-like metal-dependent hydrolase (beta-lactamase superfamily II)